MTDKLFKANILNVTDPTEYSEYIRLSMLPFGFGKKTDDTVFEIKTKLFAALYEATVNSGESFDAEIFFNSVMTDFNETFETVVPSLLLIQRAKHEKSN